MICTLIVCLGLILSSHPSHLELHVQCLYSLVDLSLGVCKCQVSLAHCWELRNKHTTWSSAVSLTWGDYLDRWTENGQRPFCSVSSGRHSDWKGRNGLLTWCCLLPPAPQIAAPTPYTHNLLFLWPLLLKCFQPPQPSACHFVMGEIHFEGNKG